MSPAASQGIVGWEEEMRKGFFVSILLLSIFDMTFAIDFNPPGPDVSLKAIGDTKGLPEILRRALEPGNDFKPIPKPASGDWLSAHPEFGQTFEGFLKSGSNRPDKSRKKIYLQASGEFPEGESPSIEKLRQYAVSYFTMEVEVLPSLALTGEDITTRINPYTKKRQILTLDILDALMKKVPRDAFCVLAITMEDLYPDPAWNFVFGQASLRDRVAIYSFARYDSAFYGEKRGGNYQEMLLRRSCRVLAHEMAHMFGLQHCIFYRCVLNGSNHLKESDSRPLHLCPVCLRKLQYSIGFDVLKRYKELLAFYRKPGFDEDAQWMDSRIRKISQE